MRKRILIALLIVAAIASGAAAFVYFFLPKVLLDATRSQYERRAGLTEKKVAVDNYIVPYYDGGSGEPLVLIHGFGDTKISFVQAAEWLTPKYRVILPEVPGFGDSVRDTGRSYGIRDQVETIHAMLKSLGIQKCHIGGNSMGGHIAAAYALAFPNEVHSLILIDAAGVTVSESKPYENASAPVRSEADFDAYLDKVFVKKPMIPRPVKTYLIERTARDFEWHNRIRGDIRSGEDYILNNRISAIAAPTLILWGDKDQLVNIDVGRAYHAGIAGSQLVVFTDCGHSPQYERPRETAEAILEFLAGLRGGVAA
jgi:pimeloyl-ACP methyl ester carboxylesterase